MFLRSGQSLSRVALGFGILAVLVIFAAKHHSADIHFAPRAVFGPDVPTGDCTISLELTGVSRVAAKRLLLYGGLEASAMARRSIMLLSNDNGITWREVMESVPGSAVFDIFLLNQLSGWTVEGPMMFFVYRTENGGASWQRLAKVPRHHFTGVPVRMEFSSEKQGQIDMEYCDGSDSDGLATLETSNGGRSWQQVSIIPCSSPDELVFEPRASPRVAVKTLRVREGDWNEPILVEESSRQDSGWRTLSELQPSFRTVDGKAITPCDPPLFQGRAGN